MQNILPLKKVLVICYYFPPCNLTPSQKGYSWAKYLHKFGYFPIIITRNWEIPIENTEDVVTPTGSDIVHIAHKDYEVYYLPHKRSLQEYLFYKGKGNRLIGLFSKILTVVNNVAHSKLDFFSPLYHDFLQHAEQLVSSQKDIKGLIITGNPFQLFKFGYLLHKKYGLNWVADYRDMWGTQKLKEIKNFLLFHDIISSVEEKAEKKWVNTAASITSVSDHYTKTISEFVKVKGTTVSNGFFHDEAPFLENIPKYTDFTICYSGSLYSKQDISIFSNGFKKFIDESNPKKNIEILFLGADWYSDQAERIKKTFMEVSQFVRITSRIPREESLNIQKKSHILLLFPYKDTESVIPSKLYEYIGLETPILFSPDDKDVVSQIIRDNDFGVVCNSADEVSKTLKNAYREFMEGNDIVLPYKTANTYKFSREYSTNCMSKVLDTL